MTAYDALSSSRVSIWLDDLSRAALQSKGSDSLAAMIRDCNVVGVTTNPSIFAAALKDGDRYAPTIAQLCEDDAATAEDVAFALMIQDVQDACDLLAPIYRDTNGKDGRVSIEVDPRLAHDTEATVEQARALWHAVDRENLMVKIPATAAGLPAVRQAISEGISVNVTLIFSPDRYRAVIDAYIEGLHDAARNGLDIQQIRSVASLFISRTDSKVDPLLDELAQAGSDEAKELRGTTGIAVARICYGAYEEAFSHPRFRELHSGRKQRPLWASTGVKDKRYPPTMYVTELVAPNTVNTMPRATLAAVGELTEIPADSVRPYVAQSMDVLHRIDQLGIELDTVYQELEDEGVEKFIASWNELIEAVQTGMERARTS
ncbi:MAG: transaldolase [Bowdeniella nasicola]|nr:transaldolase [Bowdeniella nasicola]